MTQVHEGMSDPGFQMPSNIVTATVCHKSGKRDNGLCSADYRGSALYNEYFAAGTEPSEIDLCDKHTEFGIVVPEDAGGATVDSYVPETQAEETLVEEFGPGFDDNDNSYDNGYVITEPIPPVEINVSPGN